MSKRRQRLHGAEVHQELLPLSVTTKAASVLKARNPAQKAYINSLKTSVLTFGLGPAGTGKTFIASWIAAEMLEEKAVDRILVTRPVVEAGESLGFLPGELEEKIDPYFVPVREALERRLGKGKTEYLIKAKRIEFAPLAFMRGRTFDDAFVLLDEAQNTTPKQMKMFLTRVGERTRLSVNGDLQQSDIPGPNGLCDALDRLSSGVAGVSVCRFRREDVVRSGLARAIVDAYEGDGAARLPTFITGVDREPAS